MKKPFAFFILGVAAFSMSACSITSIADQFKDEEQLAIELHNAPRFLYDTRPVENIDNLSILSNEFFIGKPYNNIVSFGDNILMVGQGIYDDSSSEELTDNEEAAYKYSFDVYNPWKNDITASLKYDEITCDSYKVVGDYLFLFDYDSQSVTQYDLNLNELAQINIDDYDSISCSLYDGGASNSFYSVNLEDRSLAKVNTNSFKLENVSCDLYAPSIIDCSDSGNSLLLTGIDKKTLRYTISALSSDSLKTLASIEGECYSGSSLSDTAYACEYDTTNSNWVFQVYNQDPLYFNMQYLMDISLLPDNTAILHQEEPYTGGEISDRTVTYYQIDKDGNCLSKFEYTCPVSSTGISSYFSTNYVYLKDCNSIMFLIYTTGVNPYILVWNLDDPCRKDMALTSSNNADDLIVPEENTDYTMISDPDNYDWGKLTSANNKACQLEEKYSVSIFLGPEVPKEIDCFTCKQDCSPKEVGIALDNLERLMSNYPDNFFSQLVIGDLKGIRIYLAGDLEGDSEGMVDDPSAFVTTVDSYLVMVLDSTISWDWPYTFNHEMSHLIDKRLDMYSNYEPESKYSEELWNAHNPEGFSYLDSYSDYYDSKAYSDNTEYFVNSYSVTYATEDRAVIFGNAMDDYISNFTSDELFISSSPLYSKLKYYCECIRDGFDSSDWDEKTPWEILITD